MLPRFMTMRTFIDILSDAPETADLPELFILYDAYRRVLAKKGRHESVREFDSFIFWGDMMISDFDDIDKSLASANDVFKNLRDVKEIQADYLNEDQKNVVTRIWGESRLTANIEDSTAVQLIICGKKTTVYPGNTLSSVSTIRPLPRLSFSSI